MTVTYTSKVVTSNGYSVFAKLLIRWKGSIYKIIWKDLIVFLLIYYIINLSYRFGMDKDSKIWFERVVVYCKQYATLIPLSFVLGFYVTLVMNRWWEQYISIPYPDNIATLLSAHVPEQDDNALLVRKTVIRYVCLGFVICMSMISPKVKRRFPTLDHLVESGLMMQDEKKILDEMNAEYPGHGKHWLPFVWSANIITKAKCQGLINSDSSVRAIIDELNIFKNKCGTLLDYDWISIPLVYTQVVTLAVYLYFCTAVVAQQYIDPDADLYFPFLAVLEYFFYMGWLKVAETLINPFGDDDDDFEINWMIDRHVLITYLIVDKIHHNHPKLMKDLYWDKPPQNLPYTVATEKYMDEFPVPSTDKIKLKNAESEILDASRRNTRETIDSPFKPHGSFLRRIFKKKDKRSHHPVNVIVEMDNIPTDSKSHTHKPECEIGNCDEFEILKMERQQMKKEKLRRYLSILKKQDISIHEEERIINDLINNF